MRSHLGQCDVAAILIVILSEVNFTLREIPTWRLHKVVGPTKTFDYLGVYPNLGIESRFGPVHDDLLVTTIRGDRGGDDLSATWSPRPAGSERRNRPEGQYQPIKGSS